MENNKQKEGLGSVIGIIIIIIVLLVGALYLVDQRIQKSKEFQATLNEGNLSSSTMMSDEIVDIEKDTTSMDLNVLGSGIDSL